MADFPELYLAWGEDEDGEPAEYRCRVTFDVAAQIEQRVALQKLAATVIRDPEAIPISHVSWIMYCMLAGAGAPVTPGQVWQAMREQALREQDVTAVIEYVIQEIYGVGPESPPKKAKGTGGKKQGKRKTPSRRR